MAAAGTAPHTTRSPASACTAWGTFGCTSTGPSQAGSRRSASSARAGSGTSSSLVMRCPPNHSPRPVRWPVSTWGWPISSPRPRASTRRTPGTPKRTADALAGAQRALTAFPRCKRDNPDRPASPCGGEGRHAASHGAPPAAGSRAQDRPGDSQRVRRDRARTVEHREHGPRATTQARPRQRGRVSPERSCSEGRG